MRPRTSAAPSIGPSGSGFQQRDTHSAAAAPCDRETDRYAASATNTQTAPADLCSGRGTPKLFATKLRLRGRACIAAPQCDRFWARYLLDADPRKLVIVV